MSTRTIPGVTYLPNPLTAFEPVPADYPFQLYAAAQQHGVKVTIQGRGPGSLEDEATAGLNYVVVTGDAIQAHVPWLWSVYQSERLRQAVEQAVGKQVAPSPHLASCININCLVGAGGRYEWHTDSQPYTVILFITTHLPGAGGALQVGSMEQPESIAPIAGDMVVD